MNKRAPSELLLNDQDPFRTRGPTAGDAYTSRQHEVRTSPPHHGTLVFKKGVPNQPPSCREAGVSLRRSRTKIPAWKWGDSLCWQKAITVAETGGGRPLCPPNPAWWGPNYGPILNPSVQLFCDVWEISGGLSMEPRWCRETPVSLNFFLWSEPFCRQYSVWGNLIRTRFSLYY